MKDLLIIITIITVIVIAIAYIIIAVGFSVYGGSECKALGYRESTLGFPLTIYCVKRVDQTDQVIELKKLQI